MEERTLAMTEKKLNYFERYLSVWVGACMVVGWGIKRKQSHLARL